MYINPMTLKLQGDLEVLKMHLGTKNEVAMLRHSKLLLEDDTCVANGRKYENGSQDQRSRSDVTNF